MGVHLDRDGRGVADEPLDVQRLAHRAPDLRVVLLYLTDAVELQGAVEHAHIGRHVVVERAGILLVEPADVGVEDLSFHAGSCRAASVSAMIPAGSAPGVSGWISQSASWSEFSTTILTRGIRRCMNSFRACSTGSAPVTRSASTMASSVHMAAPCAIRGGQACTASPIRTTRPRCHGSSRSSDSIRW